MEWAQCGQVSDPYSTKPRAHAACPSTMIRVRPQRAGTRKFGGRELRFSHHSRQSTPAHQSAQQHGRGEFRIHAHPTAQGGSQIWIFHVGYASSMRQWFRHGFGRGRGAVPREWRLPNKAGCPRSRGGRNRHLPVSINDPHMLDLERRGAGEPAGAAPCRRDRDWRATLGRVLARQLRPGDGRPVRRAADDRAAGSLATPAWPLSQIAMARSRFRAWTSCTSFPM